MSVNEISRGEWVEFCDSFSRKHHRWLVTIEVNAGSGAKQIIARDVPLEGVVADMDGDGHATILIIIGKTEKDQATHAIPNPTHIRLEQTRNGAGYNRCKDQKLGTMTPSRLVIPA